MIATLLSLGAAILHAGWNLAVKQSGDRWLALWGLFVAGGIIGLGLVTMIAECFSAWGQGVTCATGISMLSKTKGQITSQTLVLAAYTEFTGILGMVFGIAITSLMIG